MKQTTKKAKKSKLRYPIDNYSEPVKEIFTTMAGANRKLRKFSLEWWKSVMDEAAGKKVNDPAAALKTLSFSVNEYIEHLASYGYKSKVATKARIENGKKGGRPAGAKNKAPRADKGVPRKFRPATAHGVLVDDDSNPRYSA